MRLHELTLNEYADKFGKMTEPYFLEFTEKLTGKPADWVDKMRWTKYNVTFNELVKNGKLTGEQANTRYWIRAFRDDIQNVGKFMELLKSTKH